MFGKSVGQITRGRGYSSRRPPPPSLAAAPGCSTASRRPWPRLVQTGFERERLHDRKPEPAGGATTAAAASGTALSAGKYIVPGVSVGVSQGISPPTSKITVEVQVRPHLTVGGKSARAAAPVSGSITTTITDRPFPITAL